MYGAQMAQSGGAAKVFVLFVVFLLGGAVLVGLGLGDTELLNPSKHAAEVDKLEAEAEAIRAQTAYEEKQRIQQLAAEEEKTRIELEALQARRAKQARLTEPLMILLAGVVAVVVLSVAGAGSYYIFVKARILAVASKQPEPRDQATAGRVGTPEPESSVVSSSSVTEPVTAIEPTNVKDNVPTYDGILAFVDDYYFHPHSPNRYYHSGIEPELAASYESVLHSAGVLKRATNGDGEWVLRDRVIGVKEVTRRIPRQAFEARMAA